MSERSNKKDIALGVLAFGIIIGGAVWFDRAGEDASDAQTNAAALDALDEAPAAPAGADETAAAVAETVVDAGDVAADTETRDVVADVDAVVDDAPAPDVATQAVDIGPAAPSIDTFFRNPDETTIIAGRALPGQLVAIMLGAEELSRVETAADGTFGTVVFIKGAAQPRRVRVIGDPDGEAVASAESVIVPPEAAPVIAAAPEQNVPDGVTAAADDSAPAQVEDSTAPVDVASAIGDAEAPNVDTVSPTAPSLTDAGAPQAAAPPTLIADAAGVRVLQRPDPQASKPALLDNIALDTITYDTKGEVILAGRAGSDGFVQVYLDNQPITTSRISDGGDWQIDLPDVDTGVYTLRVDEVDADGNVTSRIETPFKREEPEAVAAIMAEETSAAGFDVAVRTVQPGATLWAIAEEQFGEGIMYVSVFEANRDQIRDPDLIYPGQVFRIPEIVQ